MSSYAQFTFLQSKYYYLYVYHNYSNYIPILDYSAITVMSNHCHYLNIKKKIVHFFILLIYFYDLFKLQCLRLNLSIFKQVLHFLPNTHNKHNKCMINNCIILLIPTYYTKLFSITYRNVCFSPIFHVFTCYISVK